MGLWTKLDEIVPVKVVVDYNAVLEMERDKKKGKILQISII
jgi:hypothetical protein